MSAKPRSRKAAPATHAPRIDGDLTIHHAAALHEQLRGWIEQGAEAIDLSAVGECDSAGVQLLLAARASAAAAGRRVAWSNPSAGVIEALARYGLDERLEHRAANAE
ncbi:MAG: STAS domain-containing protein [Burkholderiaceae bacterium]